MKTINIFLIPLLATFILSACSSKSQTQIIDSSKEDISSLLKTLIEKEKEINNLKLELEKCKSTK